MDQDLTDDGLHVVLGPDDAVPAHSALGPAKNPPAGEAVPTRKIQLEQPLGEKHLVLYLMAYLHGLTVNRG